MARAALKKEVTTGPEAGTIGAVEWPKFAAPEICHDLFEQICITCARGASEWGVKVADAMTTTTNNAIQFAGEIAAARSWPEVVAAYSSQAHRQFETLAGLVQEVSELNRKLATDVLAPVTSGLPEILNTIAASRWR